MTQEITSYQIPFHGDTLLVLEDRLGDRFVALRPIVDALGLDWSAQYRRLLRDSVLAEGATTLATPSAGGDQTAVALSFSLFHGWLFTIDANRVKPEAKDKLLAYQMECYDVLHSYFTEGAAWNPRFHRQEFDRSAKRIAGKQSLDMAPVAFSVISRAAERVPAHQCVEFASKALDLANQCLRPGEPCQHAQEHILKLLLADCREQLHPDEVSALTRTTATQRSKLLRKLDASGFQIRKNAQGLYEHVPPAERSESWPDLGDSDDET